VCQKIPLDGHIQKGEPPEDGSPKCLSCARDTLRLNTLRPADRPQVDYFFGACLIAACAAASRATGTRNGEQLT
jgi:hypothetical protein